MKWNPFAVMLVSSLVSTLVSLGSHARAAAPSELTPPRAATPGVGTPITRWALVVGANDGGPDRTRLRFAGTDADAFSEVMVRLGGIERGHSIVLREPSIGAVRAALVDLGRRIAASPAQPRTEVLFYYSGHSNERGLLLAGQPLPYPELRAAIEALPAQVRIAVIDSCASGAMIRAKGGERRPAFLVDEANAVHGTAVLASASASEAAQESDRVGASYFSHALVTGLRGAADVSGDDRVTLNEAYQFAFAETLGRTQSSALGPQHASYDMQLVGQGDVVLTDLTTVSARLLLDEQLVGRIFVRDAAGHLVAELRKPEGRAVQLGLAPGEYEVLVDTGKEKRLGRIRLGDQAPTRLTLAQLTPVAAEVAQARGDVEPPPPAEASWGLSFVPGLSTDGEGSRKFSLGVLGAAPKRVDVLGVSSLFNYVDGPTSGLLASGLFNATTGRSEGAVLTGLFNYNGGPGAGYHGSGLANWSTGGFDGVQNAGVFNYTGGDLRGVQASGGLNLAHGILGAQLGVLNIGGDTTGAQIGVINIGGTVHGAQIGVINVARQVEGASIAVVPVVTEGRHHALVQGGEVVHAAAAYKIGATRTHALFGVGTRFTGDERLVPMLGLGEHNPIGNGYLDLDLLSQILLDTSHLGDKNPPALYTLRVVYGWQFAPRLAVFAGPSWNVLVSDRERAAPSLGFTPALTHEGRDVRVQQWPGGVLGVQL